MLCVLCLGIVAVGVAAAATVPARQQVDVLFLSSSDPDLPDVATLIEQTETRILSGSDKPVHFSLEYLQPGSSFADPSREKGTVSYLLDKYRGQVFDLVVSINEETIDIAEQMRKKLSPGAAILFFVVNPKDPSAWLNRKAGRTGVVREVNYVPTLQLALRQNSGTTHVIVVSGSSEAEKVDAKLAREQFRPYESNLEFEYLTDIPFSELGPSLEHAPDDAVIVLLDFITDSRGEQFIPARILPMIANGASRPIYGTFSSVVGGGAVGGSVADLGEVGQALGADAVRILKGENPENIPVVTGDFQHYVVDWRQLRRWGFPPDQLPKESDVRFWEYSPWEMYRWKILGLSGLLIIETLLIVLLLRNILKLKRAQQTLHRKDKDLAEAQRVAQVGSWLWETKNETLTWSEELYRIFGLDPRARLPAYADFAPLFTSESRERLTAAVETALQTGSVPDLDLELTRADGAIKWVTARGEAVRDASDQITHLRGTVQDITEQKETYEALQESEHRFRLMANTAPVMIWTSGLDKRYGYFNQTWLDFTGRSLTVELGEGWVEGIHPEDVAGRLDTYSKNFDARQPFQMQYRLRRHDGQYRWILDAAVPRFNGDGSFAGYIGSCIDITDRKLATEALSSIGRRLIETQEEERRRIARELHDDINQRMALLANGLQEFGQTTFPNGNLPQKGELQKLLQLTTEIASDIEHISHQLHPSKLHYLGLAAAIRDLCHECSRQYKIEIKCTVRDLPEDLDQGIALSLFRAVQESLRNVGKHSDAHEVKVELSSRSGMIQLRISDDGVGFNTNDMENFHGLGLVSMRERLRSVGGEFSISSKQSLGTQVEGRVPVILKPRRERETAAQ